MPSYPKRTLRSPGIAMLLATLWVSACSYKVEKQKGSTDEISEALLNSVSYSMVNSRVFQPYCVSCHGNSGGVNLESYDNARSVLGRIQQSTVIEKRMPKAPNPPMSHDDALILAAWVKAGGPSAPLNGGPDGPGTPIPVLEPKFDSIKSVIIDKKCIRCHSVGGEAARIPLVTRSDFLDSPLDIVIPRNAEESGLILDLLDGARKKMPPLDSGYSPVSSHDIDIIKEWINNGATD